MKKIVRLCIFYTISYGLITYAWNSLLSSKLEELPTEISSIINNFIGPVGILSLILVFISFFAWKIPGLSKFLQCFFDCNQNITGTWKGVLYFKWNGENKTKTIYLSISQPNAYTIYCNLYSKDRSSYSDNAFIDKSKSINRLIYTYNAEKSIKNPNTNPQHNGITILTIGENSKTLVGEYFTNNNTSGRLELTFISRKQSASYADALKLIE